MDRLHKPFFGIIILVVVASAMLPIPALAAPSVTSVSPNPVVNNVDTVITVSGSGFESTSVVSIGLVANTFTTTYGSGSSLQVTIPTGFAVGTYDVTVTNLDTSFQTLTSGLTVVEPTPTPTATSTATPTPTASSTPAPFSRPQIVIDSYSLNVDGIRYGQDFNLNMSLANAGGSTAYGIQVTFVSTDLYMLRNGGVVVAGNLGTTGRTNFSQTMTAMTSLAGFTRVSVDMNVSYYDDKGAAYSDKFSLIFPVASSGSGGSYRPAASATPTGLHRSQLVVNTYETDITPLQPGIQFTLSMSVKNAGNLTAKGITMIIGGGSSGSGSGTPQSGISGGNGEFTNFAPVGSSNIQSLGDLQPGASMIATQKLVVNVSTNPGAYPMKITFSYQDSQGNPVNDEQVITLLVYNLPIVDVSFYQPVGILTAGQQNPLPLQVVSLGKRNFVLGKMTVSSSNGLVENGESLVGSLDPGGYFTLDALVTPNGPGPLDLVITIDYTDDFNQVRTITQTLTVDVSEMLAEPTPDMSNGGGSLPVPGTTESFWQKLWRFILGLFGLDSAAPSSPAVPVTPTEIPIPLKGPGGKG